MREAEYYLFTYTYSAVGRRIEMGARERRSQQRKEIFRDSFFSCTCFGGGLRRRILWIKSCFAHILFFFFWFVCCVWCLWSGRITRNADGIAAAHGRQAGRLQRGSLESRLVIIWRTTGNTIFESVPSSSSSCKCVGAKANDGKISRNRSTPRRRMCALSRILYSKFERSAHTHKHTLIIHRHSIVGQCLLFQVSFELFRIFYFNARCCLRRLCRRRTISLISEAHAIYYIPLSFCLSESWILWRLRTRAREMACRCNCIWNFSIVRVSCIWGDDDEEPYRILMHFDFGLIKPFVATVRILNWFRIDLSVLCARSTISRRRSNEGISSKLGSKTWLAAIVQFRLFFCPFFLFQF